MSTENQLNDSELRNWLKDDISQTLIDARSGGAVNAHVDNSYNKLGVWVALACICGAGGGAFGLASFISQRNSDENFRAVIQAEGRAVRAEIRADFADQLAKQKAELDVAKYEASIAKNTAQKLEIKLTKGQR